MKGYFYIITNKYNKVLYSGVTSNLKERIYQHKTKKHPKSFTARFNVDRLVYFETYDSIGDAIKREKQIKGGSRKKKIDLINSLNPGWKDLSDILDDV